MSMLSHLSLSFKILLALASLTTLAYLINLLFDRRAVKLTASLLMALTAGMFLYLLGERYVQAGRPPIKTLYESLILFGASVTLIYVLVERFYRLTLLGLLVSLFTLAIIAYAILKKDADIVKLPAALQSGWFIPHVVVYFLGYGGLFLGAATAMIHLIRPDRTITFANLKETRVIGYDELMHALVKFGYFLITAGLVIGAFWAKDAWGDYWTWDPKENWSLITLLIYTIYFHLRFQKTWSSKHSAILILAGFAAVMFTYLGMNLLPTAGQSEHVYQ